MSSSKTSWTLNSYDAHREPCKIELTSWCGWWAHKAPLSYKEIMTFNIDWAWGAGLRTLTPMEYIQMLTTCWEGGYSFDSGATTCKFPMILWKWPLNYVPTSDHKQLHWILKFNMGRNISLLYFFIVGALSGVTKSLLICPWEFHPTVGLRERDRFTLLSKVSRTLQWRQSAFKASENTQVTGTRPGRCVQNNTADLGAQFDLRKWHTTLSNASTIFLTSFPWQATETIQDKKKIYNT